MKERVTITGSRGTIGTVLKKGLNSAYEIVEASLPEVDVRDFDSLLKTFEGSTAVIHLAWNSEKENHKNNQIDPDSAKMFLNVYRGALEVGIKRVIMASSVHADTFIGWKGPGLITPDKIPEPDSLYGADKIFMEAAGRFFAFQGLEVVCIRFGGVNSKNSPAGPGYPAEERAAWLSHSDLTSLIKAILEVPKVPKFALMYAVSNNSGRIHDISNPFGWEPKSTAT